MKYNKNRAQGVSLLIAIIFVSALMLITAGLAETTFNAYRNIQNYRRFSRAEVLADSLQININPFIEKHEAGYNESASWGGGNSLPDPSSPTGFVLSSAVNNAKDMVGICEREGVEGVMVPCGNVSLRYDISGRPVSPLDFPGIGSGASGYPAISLDGETSHFVTPSPIMIDMDEDGEFDILEGSGDLTETCLDLDTDPDSDGRVSDEEKMNGENPCHWNKLTFGKLIEIPLYFEDADGNIIDPADADPLTGQTLDMFKIRIRTPCRFQNDDGSYYYDSNKWCDSDDRVQLYPENRASVCDPDRLSNPINRNNDVSCTVRTSDEDLQLVHWEIFSQNSENPDNPYELMVMDDAEASYGIDHRLGVVTRRKKNPNPEDDRLLPNNTEIYASKITKEQFAINRGRNQDKYNIVLEESDIGIDVHKNWDSIEKFYKDQPALHNLFFSNSPSCPENWNCASKTKPKLRLILITRPRIWNTDGLDTTSENLVPFLEYQILTNRPIGDEKKVIRSQAVIEGVRQIRKAKAYNKIIQKSFVLEN